MVVIGAGIVGSAVAMHLAERGLRPVLVDPDRAGQSASARSFASLSAFGTDPAGYYELACAALASWSRWAQRLGEVGFRRGGQLRWVADPQQGRELAEQVERARSRGYPIVPVDQAGLRRLLPAAEPGPVAAACYAPRDGQVEPDQVLGRCRAATTAAGGRLLRGAPARVRLDDDGIRVQVGELVLRPDVAVLAAGAESVTVAGAVGLDIPTLAGPGLLVETEPLPAFTDKVVYLPGGPGPQVHLRQRPDGSVLLGERSQELVARRPAPDRRSGARPGQSLSGRDPQRGDAGPGAWAAGCRRDRHGRAGVAACVVSARPLRRAGDAGRARRRGGVPVIARGRDGRWQELTERWRPQGGGLKVPAVAGRLHWVTRPR